MSLRYGLWSRYQSGIKKTFRKEESADMTERTDQLLRSYVLGLFRDACSSDHLAECPEAVVTDYDATDGTYGCATGCDYVRFSITVTCPHDHTINWESGEFGELSWIINDLLREDTNDSG